MDNIERGAISNKPLSTIRIAFLTKGLLPLAAGQAFRPQFCSVPPEGGMCRASLRRWFFNEKTDKCERFVYGGCGGNRNNFASKDECTEACRRKCPLLLGCLIKCAVGQQTDENGCRICNCINGNPCKVGPLVLSMQEHNSNVMFVSKWFKYVIY